MVNAADIVRAFMTAWETQDWDTMSDYMDETFSLIGPTPEPLGKRWVIADSKARWAAFPDWKFNFQIVKEEGNMVTVRTRITATHTGTLISPFPGMAPIPPTGKKISLPEEDAVLTVRGNKIVEYNVEHLPHGGYRGILQQIGVEVPEQDD